MEYFDAEGGVRTIGGQNILERAVSALKECETIDQIVVSADEPAILEQAREMGATLVVLRPKELSDRSVTIPRVLNFTLEALEAEHGVQAGIVVFVAATYPFRPPELVDQLVQTLDAENLDSIFTVAEARHNYWRHDENGRISRIYEGDPYRTRDVKDPLYKELQGLVCASRREFVTDKHLLGKNIAVTPIHDAKIQVDLRDPIGQLVADVYT